MIYLIENFIRTNWDRLFPNAKMPQKIMFLKLRGSPSVNRAIPFLIFAEQSSHPFAFVKVPRNCNSRLNLGLQIEYKNLNYLQKVISSSYILRSIPHPICLEKISNCLCLFETSICGKKMNNLTIKGKKKINRMMDIVFDWLVHFHLETRTSQKKFDECIVEKHLGRETRRFLTKFHSLGPQYKNTLTENLQNIAIVYKNENIPIMFQCGDISRHNIFLENGKINVVDWEDSVRESLPYIDIYDFLVNFLCTLNPKKVISDKFKFYFVNKGHDDVVSYYLSKYCCALDINRDLMRALFPFYLVRTINRDARKYPDDLTKPLRWTNRLKVYLKSEIH